jgi:hypothetical protein
LPAAAFTVVVAGCGADEARWDAWRRACDLSEGEYVAVPYDDEQSYVEIPEACSERLGRDVGLDWASFDAEPRAFSRAENAAEWVVAGLYVLASADLGTFRDLRAQLVDGELLEEELPEYDALWDFGDSEPAGRFWIAWLTHDRIGSVANYPDDENTLLAEAFYGDVQIHRSTEALLAGEHRSPTGAMAVLVHEAAHWTAPHHDAETQTDDSFDGAYGVEARILDSWTRAHPATPESELARGILSWVCVEKIENSGEFPPCDSFQIGGDE